MPRRKKQQRQQRRRNSDSISTVVRTLGTATLAAGVQTQGVYPGAFAIATALGDVYEFYRVVSLRYRLHPGTTITATQAIGYIPGNVDTPSGITATVISQLDNHALLTVRQVTPTNWVKVNRSKLSSYMTWYKTIVGSTTTAEEIQGYLYLAGTGTETVTYEVELVYQFRTLVATAATPQVRAQREMLAEKERLLKILSYNPTSPCPPVGRSSLPSPSQPFVPLSG